MIWFEQNYLRFRGNRSKFDTYKEFSYFGDIFLSWFDLKLSTVNTTNIFARLVIFVLLWREELFILIDELIPMSQSLQLKNSLEAAMANPELESDWNSVMEICDLIEKNGVS